MIGMGWDEQRVAHRPGRARPRPAAHERRLPRGGRRLADHLRQPGGGTHPRPLRGGAVRARPVGPAGRAAAARPGGDAAGRPPPRTSRPASTYACAGTGLRYHLRLVPGPDGRTLYFQDVTEKRRHEEERRIAERAASERAARIAELTTALAKATTSRDVVEAVARRVLPPFAATGLAVQTIEDHRLLHRRSHRLPEGLPRRDRQAGH